MSAILMRGYNNYDVREASEEAADIGDYGESMTVQSQAEDADINVMMKRMHMTGQMPSNPRIPSYGDFTHITDYRSAIEAIRNADAGFMEFPAEVRAKFDNDPQKLLMFASQEANASKLVEIFGGNPSVQRQGQSSSVNSPAGGNAQPAGGGSPSDGGTVKGSGGAA
jgi:hypothetical protein